MAGPGGRDPRRQRIRRVAIGLVLAFVGIEVLAVIMVIVAGR